MNAGIAHCGSIDCACWRCELNRQEQSILDGATSRQAKAAQESATLMRLRRIYKDLGWHAGTHPVDRDLSLMIHHAFSDNPPKACPACRSDTCKVWNG